MASLAEWRPPAGHPKLTPSAGGTEGDPGLSVLRRFAARLSHAIPLESLSDIVDPWPAVTLLLKCRGENRTGGGDARSARNVVVAKRLYALFGSKPRRAKNVFAFDRWIR